MMEFVSEAKDVVERIVANWNDFATSRMINCTHKVVKGSIEVDPIADYISDHWTFIVDLR